MSTSTLPEIDNLSLLVTQEIRVNAPIEVTFESLLEQLVDNEMHDGTKMPMKLEAVPGGRWYRDLGNNNGHLWAHVQAIKRPTLLEFAGPLMMSYPVANNVQYRLSEENGVTLIKFRHSAFGLLQDDHRRGVSIGWNHINDRVRQRAEKSAAR
jgi:Activator of Hsp90 ATPase homolog 1-like protein